MFHLRTTLEIASRRIVFQRRLPRRFGGGRVIVSPGSALRYWSRNLETVDPLLFAAAEELVSPGDVVWDIGANVGLFAFAAAGLAGNAGRVLAVEPDAWLATLLHRSASLSNLNSAKVDVLPAAVSGTIGLANLCIASRGRSSNHLAGAGNSQSGGTKANQSALSLTLDWLLNIYPPPNVLKIDVEGAEGSVLKGATRLLSEARPLILCEVSERNTTEITKIFQNFGYSFFDADTPRASREPLCSAAWNSIAYPPASKAQTDARSMRA